MDTHLMSVERAAERARDEAERDEEVRVISPAEAAALLDEWLEKQRPELEYLRTVDALDWYQDHTEALHLPHDDHDSNQVIASRLRADLYAAAKASDEEAWDTEARIAVQIVRGLRSNLRIWVEETDEIGMAI